MKTRYILFALAALVVSAACSKTVEQPEPEGIQMTFTAYQEGSHGTKTTVQDGGTKVYWEPADEIKVFFKGTGGRFVSLNSSLADVADFTGTLSIAVGANEGASSSNLTWGLYPYRADATSDGSSVTTTLPAEQTGRAGSFAKNTHITLAKSGGYDLGFYNVTGGLRFSLTQEGIKSVTFEGQNNEAVAGTFKAAFSGGVPVVQQVSDPQTKITLTAPGGGTFQKGQWYYIAALPGTLSNGFKMTFYKESQSAKLTSSNSVTIKRGAFGSLADADEGLVFSADSDAPDAVDLGLSVKWATFNVGASSPEEYGNFFAWGETELKEDYSWKTYKWYNGGWSMPLLKYQSGVDNKTLLDAEDDAAYVKWDGNWRMPTYSEISELIRDCNWTLEVMNGVKGFRVSSNKAGFSDKSIFLPLAGRMDGTNLEIENDITYPWSDYTYYWTPCIVASGDNHHSWCIEFNENSRKGEIVGIDRHYGCLIRPVYSDYIPVSSISVPEAMELYVGQSIRIDPEVLPGNATWPGVSNTFEDSHVVLYPNPENYSRASVVYANSVGTSTIEYYASNGLKATCEVTVKPAPESNPEAVDLGLSVDWAAFNIGASAPEDFGYYFAWGETEPHDDGNYDWTTYRWCQGSYNSLTKYNSNANFGLVDNLNVLDLEDDAARINWGGAWRTPTEEEFLELYNGCTWALTTKNGVQGFQGTSKYTGKSIFFPVAGLVQGKFLQDHDYCGHYWLSGADLSAAFYHPDNIFCTGWSRCFGFPIRPVREKTMAPEAIDLGLSVKWASCNVGANAPEEYGDYFAWGETKPKENYDWSTYKFELGTDYNGPFSKYVTKSSYGAVDNNTILDPEDDAAHVNWGGSWRMPTDAEWIELINSCTWTCTAQNGVNGRMVTGPNGNSIFLPAAGVRGDADLSGVGSDGGYWSSSLDSGNPYRAWYVFFYSGSVYSYANFHRFLGYSVRPVSE